MSSVTEAALRVRDLAMMQVHNSMERELEEWVAVLIGGMRGECSAADRELDVGSGSWKR